MSLNPTLFTALIASLPALVLLVVSLLIGQALARSAYRRAMAQSREEIDRLRESLQGEQERQEEGRQRLSGDLNHLRAEWLERYRSLHGEMESVGRARHNASAFDFRPGTFEGLWGRVLKIRQFVTPILSIYCLPSASDFLPVDERLRHLLPQNEDEDFRKKAEELAEGAESARPFLGEDVWQIYSVYYAYAVRTAWKVIAGKMRGQVPPWDKDFEGSDDTRQMLGLVLTEEEIEMAIGDRGAGAPLRILTALECMMLDAMNVWMFGAPLSHLALKDRELLAASALPEADLILPAARVPSAPVLGTIHLAAAPKFKKSINPRLRVR